MRSELVVGEPTLYERGSTQTLGRIVGELLERLLPELQQRFKERGLSIVEGPPQYVRFSPIHADVGEIQIYDDGDESPLSTAISRTAITASGTLAPLLEKRGDRHRVSRPTGTFRRPSPNVGIT